MASSSEVIFPYSSTAFDAPDQGDESATAHVSRGTDSRSEWSQIRRMISPSFWTAAPYRQPRIWRRAEKCDQTKGPPRAQRLATGHASTPRPFRATEACSRSELVPAEAFPAAFFVGRGGSPVGVGPTALGFSGAIVFHVTLFQKGHGTARDQAHTRPFASKPYPA
jgi:hypothetical protein